MKLAWKNGKHSPNMPISCCWQEPVVPSPHYPSMPQPTISSAVPSLLVIEFNILLAFKDGFGKATKWNKIDDWEWIISQLAETYYQIVKV